MIEENSCQVGDCLNIFSVVNDPFINLTITSPPYNVDLGNDYRNITNHYDLYDDNKDYKDYLEYLEIRFKEIFRLTLPNGRCVVNIGDQKNGEIPLSIDLFNFMIKMGWKPYTHIIWNKKQCNPRTAWGSFCKPTQPSFPTPFEHILVFYKGEKNLKRIGETDLNKEEFIKYSLALWEFPGAKKSKTKHPAAFPEEIPYRCIKMFSYVGDMVVDPFAGIGTTLKVSSRLNRRYFGCELSSNYVDIFNQYKNQQQ